MDGNSTRSFGLLHIIRILKMCCTIPGLHKFLDCSEQIHVFLITVHVLYMSFTHYQKCCFVTLDQHYAMYTCRCITRIYMASRYHQWELWEKSECFVLCSIVATLYVHRQSAFLIGRDRKVCGFFIACVYHFYFLYTLHLDTKLTRDCSISTCTVYVDKVLEMAYRVVQLF